MSKQLPPQPHLDHLKQQAKDLLKAHKAAEPEAVQRIKAHTPKWMQWSDTAIFEETGFTLRDAQHVIAGEYGFASWPKLVAAVNALGQDVPPNSAAPGDLQAEFLDAVRTLHLDRVRQRLAEDPSLANAEVLEEEGPARPVHFAAFGHAELLRLLIDYDADVNALAHNGEYGMTPPLPLACWEGTVETVRLLLEAGADPNLPATPGGSALHAAINHYNTEKIELLLRHGAQHDIYTAAAVGDLGAVKRLLDGDPGLLNRRDPIRRKRPLEWAGNDEAVAQFLIEAGAEVTPKAMLALGLLEPIRQAVTADPSFATRPLSTDNPNPPLLEAIGAGQTEVVQYLLAVGADPNAPGTGEQLPLPYAVELPRDTSLQIVEILLRAGADPNAEHWRSPLAWFVLKDNFDAAEILLRYGADINLLNRSGRTILQDMIGPIRYGDPTPKVAFLLTHGAEVNRLSADGKTALDIALEKEVLDTALEKSREKVAHLLREHGGKQANELR